MRYRNLWQTYGRVEHTDRNVELATGSSQQHITQERLLHGDTANILYYLIYKWIDRAYTQALNSYLDMQSSFQIVWQDSTAHRIICSNV